MSNTFKPHFDIAFDVPDSKDHYPKYFTLLKDFYDNYLNTVAFTAILPLSAEEFFKPTDLSVQRINGRSNEFQFGNSAGFESKSDLKRLKPYKPVPRLGGVPWRLKRDTTNELIVGVGAYYSITGISKYEGWLSVLIAKAYSKALIASVQIIRIISQVQSGRQ